jgi:hypothetical protein
MPRNAQQCAWVGCSKTSDKQSFGSPRPVDTLLQSLLLKLVPHSGVLCNQHGTAWRRHAQQLSSVPAGATDGVATLLSAAAADASSSSSSSSPLSSSNAAPVLAVIVQPQPTSQQTPPRQQGRRFGSDITNTVQHSPLRRSFTASTKRKLLLQYVAVPHGDKQQWLQQRNLSYERIAEWKKQQQRRAALPEAQRPNLQRRRGGGGGRKAVLSPEMELSIRAWVVSRRQGIAPDYFRHVVTVSQLLVYASAVSGKALSDGWLWGFMDRHKLGLRAVTTNKVSDTPFIKEVLEEFRYQHRDLLSDSARQVNIINMDETAIFFNMSHKRTIDVKGVRTVAAHETKQADGRVTVVVWVTAAGEVGPPLIVHMKPPPKGECKTEKGKAARLELAKLKNKPQRLFVRIPVYNKEHEDEVVEADEVEGGDHGSAAAAERRERMRARDAATTYRDVVIYTCHNDSGWMVERLMLPWLEHVFVPNSKADSDGWRYLVMDNCGPHETDEVVAVMRRLHIKEIMLPPNYSQLLQPLDHSLNALIKYVYRLEHAHWLLRDITQPTTPAVVAAAPVGAAARGRKRKREQLISDSRTRAPTKEEVEVRVATAVYALTSSHIRRCWRHTLNGRRLLEAAISGHNQREKDGVQVFVPLSRKRRKKAAAATAERQRQSSAAVDAEAAAVDAVGDDLHVVPMGESSDDE